MAMEFRCDVCGAPMQNNHRVLETRAEGGIYLTIAVMPPDGPHLCNKCLARRLCDVAESLGFFADPAESEEPEL